MNSLKIRSIIVSTSHTCQFSLLNLLKKVYFDEWEILTTQSNEFKSFLKYLPPLLNSDTDTE
jgi:hypothetical protein